jgi:predicted Zn-dependent protease with MMP-like domain
VTTERFGELVEQAVAEIPEYFRSRFANISIDVRPIAPIDLSRNMARHPMNLLGVYQGVPYNHRGPWYGNVLPDRILIFQQPIERLTHSEEDVRRLVRRVVIHEVGHYFGMSDEELHRLERESEPTPPDQA